MELVFQTRGRRDAALIIHNCMSIVTRVKMFFLNGHAKYCLLNSNLVFIMLLAEHN